MIEESLLEKLMISLGWLITSFILFLSIIAIDLSQNFFNWHSALRIETIFYSLILVGCLGLLWKLSTNTHDRISRIVSALTCAALLCVGMRLGFMNEDAIDIRGKEHLMNELSFLARYVAPPLWYRISRSLVLFLPSAFWLLNTRLR